MDQGRFMFVVVIPPRFELDQRAGRHPDIQLNIDATAMTQAAIGSTYIKNIINDRVSSFFRAYSESAELPVNLIIRRFFNPNGEILLVHERRRHHQPSDPPNRYSDGCRRDPRT